MPRPAWKSTGARRSWASATSCSTTGCGRPKASDRGWSLKPRAPAARQRCASASAPSAFGATRASGRRRPPAAAHAASTPSAAAESPTGSCIANSSARRCPAASRPARISCAVAVMPSGSCCPMCVWASNQSSGARPSRALRSTACNQGSRVIPRTGIAGGRLDHRTRRGRCRARALGQNRPVPHGDRLTALDATFLHLEEGGAHMHVASILVFEGEAPPYGELVRAIEDRLRLVPRYRQRLAHVPLGQGRPVWVDDPYFNARYHLRHTALPAPGGDEQLAALAGRLFAQQLDRGKPLWEIYLVEGLHPGAGGDPRFALIAKTHHALVDSVSGVDITSVLFDAVPEPAPAAGPGRRWEPAPLPSAGQLLADALIERVTMPGEAARPFATGMRAPLRLARPLAEPLTGLGAVARLGMTPAPASPVNVRIGPHRRYAW